MSIRRHRESDSSYDHCRAMTTFDDKDLGTKRTDRQQQHHEFMMKIQHTRISVFGSRQKRGQSVEQSSSLVARAWVVKLEDVLKDGSGRFSDTVTSLCGVLVSEKAISSAPCVGISKFKTRVCNATPFAQFHSVPFQVPIVEVYTKKKKKKRQRPRGLVGLVTRTEQIFAIPNTLRLP